MATLKNYGPMLVLARQYWRTSESDSELSKALSYSIQLLTRYRSIVINHLMTKYAMSKSFCCLYVYFDYREQAQQTYENILKCLLAQVLCNSDEVTAKTKAIHEDWIFRGIPPGPDEYITMLQSEIKAFTKVYIVVDALDECVDDPMANTVVNVVNALNKLPYNTRILFTSRYLSIVEERVKPDVIIEIRANSDDLKAYFGSRIDSLDQLKRLVDKGQHIDPLFLEKASDKIVKRSQGMFLLAHLHIEFLASSQTLEDLESGINKLTTSPDEVYSKALVQIKNQMEPKRRLAMMALTWLVYSERILSVDELVHALSVRENDTMIHEHRLLADDTISSACAGLVVVDREADTVSLAHYTAEEYLRTAEVFRDPQPYLLETCLIYMSFVEFSQSLKTVEEREDRLKKYPFLKYAVNHWGDHVTQNSRVTERAWNFLCDVKRVQNAFKVMADFPFQQEPHVTGLHIAAFFGLDKLVRKGMRMEPDPNRQVNSINSSGETALHWAAKYRQPRFLKLLIDNDIDLNLTDDVRNRTALHYAVMNRDVTSVKVLLESKRHCDLQLQDCHGWTPLRWAAAYGHATLVKILLAQGPEIDAKDKDGWSALRWALQRGHIHVAEMLIEAGAELKTKNWTLLHWAAREGCTAVIRLLVERRADLDEVDHEHRWTALRWAVEYGRGMTAWLLLQGHANVNQADSRGCAPLHVAVEKWKPAEARLSRGGVDLEGSSLLWLLLENGADMGAQTKLGLSALHIATTQGHAAVTWLLLNKGSDPMLRDNNGRTPLHCAVTEGHLDVAQLLISQENGQMLIQAGDSEKRTALHVAASIGDLPMVEMLIAHYAPLNVRDQEGYTALHRAVTQQHLRVVTALVANGADVNVTNKSKKRWTPLHSAANDGNKKIIRALCKSPGINISVHDSAGQKAVDVARRQGHDIEGSLRMI